MAFLMDFTLNVLDEAGGLLAAALFVAVLLASGIARFWPDAARRHPQPRDSDRNKD